MAASARHIPMPELLWRLQTTLHMTQKQLGALVGLSSRTIIRYYQGGGMFLPTQWATLAKALQPHDAALATYCARMSTGSIEEIVGGKLPAIPAPVQAASTAAPGAPTASPPARPMPSAAHMADSVVCVGAEAMQCTPTQMRQGLLACLQRMVALGMSAEETLGAMRPPDAGDKGGKPKGK